MAHDPLLPKYVLPCSDADIEAEDQNLMTPLMLATKNEHEEVC